MAAELPFDRLQIVYHLAIAPERKALGLENVLRTDMQPSD